MRFFLNMDPPRATGQMRKCMVRNGQPFFYDPPAVKTAKRDLTLMLMRYVPRKAIDGPVQLHVIWYFRTRTRKLNGTYKTTRPDTDNLQKILKDVMTVCGFWRDDALVVDERVEKRWSLNPGIEIEMEEIEYE